MSLDTIPIGDAVLVSIPLTFLFPFFLEAKEAVSLRWGCGYDERNAHRGHHGAAASPPLRPSPKLMSLDIIPIK